MDMVQELVNLAIDTGFAEAGLLMLGAPGAVVGLIAFYRKKRKLDR